MNDKCNHDNAEIVDEWDEIEDDLHRLTPFTIHIIKYECVDCGETFEMVYEK